MTQADFNSALVRVVHCLFIAGCSSVQSFALFTQALLKSEESFDRFDTLLRVLCDLGPSFGLKSTLAELTSYFPSVSRVRDCP